MLHILKQLLLFKVGQKAAKGFARGIGLRALALPIGLVAGYKYMKRHSHS